MQFYPQLNEENIKRMCNKYLLDMVETRLGRMQLKMGFMVVLVVGVVVGHQPELNQV